MTEPRSRNRSDGRQRREGRDLRRPRRSRKDRVLDLVQNVLDDTADFVDESIDRARGDDLDDEVEELREAVALLSARLDQFLVDRAGGSGESRAASKAAS